MNGENMMKKDWAEVATCIVSDAHKTELHACSRFEDGELRVFFALKRPADGEHWEIPREVAETLLLMRQVETGRSNA